PRRLPHVDRPVVSDPLAGKFSVQSTSAVALSDSNDGREHFQAAALALEVIRILAAIEYAGLRDGDIGGLGQPCLMRITLVDGARYETRLDAPAGREPADYPRNMEAKFLACATRVLSPSDAKGVYDLTRKFETLGAVRDLTARLVVSAGEPLGGSQR